MFLVSVVFYAVRKILKHLVSENIYLLTLLYILVKFGNIFIHILICLICILYLCVWLGFILFAPFTNSSQAKYQNIFSPKYY